MPLDLGPWEVCGILDSRTFDETASQVLKIGHAKSGTDVAYVAICDPEERERISKKIAAAPELLEALQRCLSEFEERYDLTASSTNPGIKIAAELARAAIAKATT